ncbi:hypothetical protein [Stenomitos frigidus]|nr:hypothetical protein [Stenomitos frigidus]
MGSSTHEANGNHHDRSDLTQIRGIGAVRKRWLYSLGIDTIAALAQASADAIEAQAKSDGRSLSRDELEEWIAQARVHHAQASLEQAESSHVVEAITPIGDSKPLVSDRREAEGEQLTVWNSIASFKVDYKIRQVDGKVEQRIIAHHLETDTVESWPAFETDLMQQWMRDRVEVTLRSLHVDSPIVAAPIVAEITQLRVFQPHHMKQPMVVDKNSPIFPDALQTTEPFALEVSMRFTGLTEVNQEKQVAYRVQCLARNLATGATDILGDVTAHVSPSNNSAYKVLLPSLLLPQPGAYRLKVFVTLQQAPATLGQFKVPMLQVI